MTKFKPLLQLDGCRLLQKWEKAVEKCYWEGIQSFCVKAHILVLLLFSSPYPAEIMYHVSTGPVHSLVEGVSSPRSEWHFLPDALADVCNPTQSFLFSSSPSYFLSSLAGRRNLGFSPSDWSTSCSWAILSFETVRHGVSRGTWGEESKTSQQGFSKLMCAFYAMYAN